jgi:hypothetical protein
VAADARRGGVDLTRAAATFHRFTHEVWDGWSVNSLGL